MSQGLQTFGPDGSIELDLTTQTLIHQGTFVSNQSVGSLNVPGFRGGRGFVTAIITSSEPYYNFLVYVDMELVVTNSGFTWQHKVSDYIQEHYPNTYTFIYGTY